MIRSILRSNATGRCNRLRTHVECRRSYATAAMRAIATRFVASRATILNAPEDRSPEKIPRRLRQLLGPLPHESPFQPGANHPRASPGDSRAAYRVPQHEGGFFDHGKAPACGSSRQLTYMLPLSTHTVSQAYLVRKGDLALHATCAGARRVGHFTRKRGKAY